jgi:hypothetical protein
MKQEQRELLGHSNDIPSGKEYERIDRKDVGGCLGRGRCVLFLPILVAIGSVGDDAGSVRGVRNQHPCSRVYLGNII